MPEKILLVEDDVKNMKLITMALRSNNYTLLKATDGEEALDIDKASRQLYDIHKEIAQAVHTGGAISAQQADKARKFLKQTREVIERAVPPPIPDELKRKVDELHRLMEERMHEGVDVSEAKRLDDKSKEYAHRGDMKVAAAVISKAIDLLKQK